MRHVLDYYSLSDKYRELDIARKIFVGLDNNIFVGDNAVEFNVVAYICVLHEYAVFNHGTLADMNASEKNAVFNGALNYAAVRNERIGSVGIKTVDSRTSSLTFVNTGFSFAKSALRFSFLRRSMFASK